MQKIQCEACGSADLIKQDGLFVCQCCGLKYSLEEVRKLLVTLSGPVRVEGISTVDQEVEKAETFLRLGDRKKAEDAFKAITDNYPADARGWTGLARIKASALYGKSAVARFLPKPGNRFEAVSNLSYAAEIDKLFANALATANEAVRPAVLAAKAEAQAMADKRAAETEAAAERMRQRALSVTAEELYSLQNMSNINRKYDYRVYGGRLFMTLTSVYTESGDRYSSVSLFKLEVRNGTVFLGLVDTRNNDIQWFINGKDTRLARSRFEKAYDRLLMVRADDARITVNGESRLQKTIPVEVAELMAANVTGSYVFKGFTEAEFYSLLDKNREQARAALAR